MDLAQVLRHLPRIQDDRLIVGLETSDDAGVLRIDDDRCLIQTLDFFTPIVDDPYDYGQIAAANSLSDVYAMGGTPLTAMNIVCYPMSEMPQATLVEILRGGSDKVAEAGALPLLPGAREHAASGVNTGGGRSNADYLGRQVTFDDDVDEPARALLFDPQTSGGLLIAVEPDLTARLLEELAAEGVNVRAVI